MNVFIIYVLNFGHLNIFLITNDHIFWIDGENPSFFFGYRDKSVCVNNFS